MARTLRDTQLDTRAARARLKPRGKPYYRTIEEGLHLGYRKPRGRKGKPAVSGKWVLRRYIREQKYVVEKIGIADDYADADGVAILSFSDAQNKARDLFKQNAHAEAGSGPYTVAVAIRDYLQNLEHRGKDKYDAEHRANAHILPKLGTIECNKLTDDRLWGWLSALASAPAHVRTPEGEKQKYREHDTGNPEEIRKRKASANKVWTTLRAALNLAFERKKVTSDAAWRRVKPYEQVDTARIRFLSIAEAKRLINVCEPAFRPMVEAALSTGCRYGELCALDVHDFDRDHATLNIRRSKSGKARKVYLSDEGVRLFKRLTDGRLGSDPLMCHSNGERCGHSYQLRPMRDACRKAKIKPVIGFHGLRHTFASLLVKSGTPMRYVAEALGHTSTAMTEKYYAHLAPSHVADTIRENAPVFGLGKSNVVGLR